MKPYTYKELFAQIPVEKTPPFVVAKIEAQINSAQIHRNLIRGTIYALITCGAIAACVPAITSMINAMVSSGFTSYASILLTEGTNVLSSWKELGMALIESLPMLSIMAVLALLIGSIYSMSKSISYIKGAKILSV